MHLEGADKFTLPAPGLWISAPQLGEQIILASSQLKLNIADSSQVCIYNAPMVAGSFLSALGSHGKEGVLSLESKSDLGRSYQVCSSH